MNDVLNTLVYPMLFTIITVYGGILAKKFCDFINAKIDKAQTNKELAKYAQLNKYIDVAQSAITTAVTTVSQTYVDDIKKSGTFDATAQAKAKADAIELSKTLITDDAKSAITILFGDFEKYLDSSIEAIIKKSK